MTHDTGHGATWAQQDIADQVARASHQPPGNTAPRFLTGGNLPRRDLLDVHPAWIAVGLVACVAAFIAFDWLVQRYLF